MAPDTCSQTSGLQTESMFLLFSAPWFEVHGHGSPRPLAQTPGFTRSVNIEHIACLASWASLFG